MELKEFQKKADEIINKIDDKKGCAHNLNNTILHLIEELGEVANQLGKPGIRNEQINKQELGKELADVLIFLARIANLNNINLEHSINSKITELNQRHNLNL
jgi:NTP pyrophosphatase (non-canonical NTP hydrolase)